MAVAALPSYGPFDDGLGLGLMEACDRRALVREAAALWLERAEAGVLAWPRTQTAVRGGERGTDGRAD